MLALIAIWALAEAVLFFIVADVPIMALGIRSGVKKALVGACLAAIMATVGGLVVFNLAAQNPEATRAMIEAVPAITPELVDESIASWRMDGSLAMVAGSFSGVPYKIYAYVAGASAETGWIAFIWMSILARLPRFALVALASGWAGPRLVARFGARPVWTAFALAWAAFYAIYWSAMGF